VGTWGPAVFSDDLACDVRDDFRDLIADGASPEDATEQLLRQYRSSLGNDDERAVVWLALASSQWSAGRLIPSVREPAIAIIESGEDLRRLETLGADSGFLSRRRTALSKLRDQLQREPPPPRKIRRRFRSRAFFSAGDILLCRPNNDVRLLFVVADPHVDKGGSGDRLVQLTWSGNAAPKGRKLKRLVDEARRGSFGARSRADRAAWVVFQRTQKDEPPAWVEPIDHVQWKSPKVSWGGLVTWWSQLAADLTERR
jgi:hypothetical protein